ncbi:MAG: KamA family radical SAM protein [Planctomycetota bacterium]
MISSQSSDDSEASPDEPEPPGPPSPRTTPHPSTRLHPRISAPALLPASSAEQFRRTFFPEATAEDWSDWRWQLRKRLRSPEEFQRVFDLSTEELAALQGMRGKFPAAVTPFYASLLNRTDPGQPLRRSVIPTLSEFETHYGEADDPLAEDACSPVEGLVHRYPDRALFLVSDHCAVYCRYCTRARVVGSGAMSPNVKRWEGAFRYLEAHQEVRDVLISGGDPLTLSDDKLDYLLSRLRAIPHLEFIRIGTKVPAVLPQRVTPELTQVLSRYHPLWMSLHFTHGDELVPEVVAACERLANAGIPLGSQTVLLRGINDNVPTLKRLFHGLLRARVRPYYLYQCDPISGSAHLRTPVETGLELIAGLRGHTTGYAVPQFVIDAPGGGGKIPLMADAVLGRDGDDLLLRNWAGGTFRYPDPLPEPVLAVTRRGRNGSGRRGTPRNGGVRR